ncbi:MAG: hypothetical protein GXY67_07425 [Clostridiales bacterium]|nr:hypothetical protein [Clostridiales bacterium]
MRTLPTLHHVHGGDSLLFFNDKTGTLTFETSLCLTPFMIRRDLMAALQDAGSTIHDLDKSDILPLPAFAVEGGTLAPVCFLLNDRLVAVTLTASSVGQKTALTGEQQRAFLFASFRAKDPCPDTLRNCILHGGFGSITLCTDPRSGHASARIAWS